MIAAHAQSNGHLIAAVLSGAWRHDAPELKITADELKRIAPLLLHSGAAALGWRRIRASDLKRSNEAAELRQAFRLYTLQAAIHTRKIERVVTHLHSFGIEPVLVKGWAIARLYPEPGLRPHGDIDLCVRAGEYTAAQTALKSLKDLRLDVDLHKEFAAFGDDCASEMFARSQTIKLRGTDVRVLCAEDHLRVLCAHFLREGAWRPLWLCDVAVALETRPANFDWSVCLTKSRRAANWVGCAADLAHCLLGARIVGTPLESARLPEWIAPTVLNEWESPSMMQRHLAPMRNGLRRSPDRTWDGVRHRWPNGIEATIASRATFDDLPRLPLQINTFLARATSFLWSQLKPLR